VAKGKPAAREAAPVESMTGFGAGRARAGGFRAEVEVRAVNGRYLTLKVRVPPEYSALEDELRRLVEPRLVRGSAEVRAEVAADGAGRSAGVDAERVAAYVREWRRLAKRLGLRGELSVDCLAGLPQLFSAGRDRSAADRALPALAAAAAAAIEKLAGMRRREGAALARDLAGHLDRLEELRAGLAGRAPEAVRALAERAGERLRKVLEGSGAPAGAVRPEDLAREAAWLAERSDFTEELDRLASHIGQFRGALAAGGQVGKRLDFLVQEMHREVSTLGSKAADTELSRLAVEAKLQVEKLREQVQNLL
jgi:uncharacterized protein (TIGR00255 family)